MNWEKDSKLLEISGRACHAREVFLSDLKKLPEACEIAVCDKYKARLKDRDGAPLLGEFAPWMLSDILAVESPNSAERILSPWMGLYVHTLLLDDIIDTNDKRVAAPVLIASSLIAERSIRRLHEMFPHDSWVKLKLDESFLEMATAAIDEIQNHRNSLQIYSEKDIADIGKKFSILNLCGAMLLGDSREDVLDDSALLPVSLLSSGMQLLDDITDWYDDWQIGNYTPLLTETLDFLNSLTIGSSLPSANFSRCHLLAGMILSGSLENCLLKAEQILTEMFELSSCNIHSVTDHFFSLVLSETARFRESVIEVRNRLSHEQALGTILWNDLFEPSKRILTWITEVDRGIKIVAQGC